MTRYFVASAIIIRQEDWLTTLRDLVAFRRDMKARTGLKLSDEIHATNFVNRPGDLVRIKRNVRVNILKLCADWLATRDNLSVITVRVDKEANPSIDPFDMAWRTLLQRCENTLKHGNMPGQNGRAGHGIILSDETIGGQLTKLMRKMRHFNPIPSKFGPEPRNIPIEHIIEDPMFRVSRNSMMHQMADVVAYLAMQVYQPNGFFKKHGIKNYYGRLGASICTQAAPGNAMRFHIVER